MDERILGAEPLGPFPFSAFIHPSAWKRCSQKSISRKLHSPGPLPPARRFLIILVIVVILLLQNLLWGGKGF